jgi:hypothetical protein
VPHVIALALLGAGLYAGYRWFARAAGDFGATVVGAKDELRQHSERRIEKDLGALEFDPASGVYRPAKRH